MDCHTRTKIEDNNHVFKLQIMHMRDTYLARIVVWNCEGKDTLCPRCKLINCDGCNYLPKGTQKLLRIFTTSATATSLPQKSICHPGFKESPKAHNAQEKRSLQAQQSSSSEQTVDSNTCNLSKAVIDICVTNPQLNQYRKVYLHLTLCQLSHQLWCCCFWMMWSHLPGGPHHASLHWKWRPTEHHNAYIWCRPPKTVMTKKKKAEANVQVYILFPFPIKLHSFAWLFASPIQIGLLWQQQIYGHRCSPLSEDLQKDENNHFCH